MWICSICHDLSYSVRIFKTALILIQLIIFRKQGRIFFFPQPECNFYGFKHSSLNCNGPHLVEKKKFILYVFPLFIGKVSWCKLVLEIVPTHSCACCTQLCYQTGSGFSNAQWNVRSASGKWSGGMNLRRIHWSEFPPDIVVNARISVDLICKLCRNVNLYLSNLSWGNKFLRVQADRLKNVLVCIQHA